MNKHNSTAFQGELYLFSQSILWSLFPIISILAFFILKEIPSIWQILGLIPIITGIFVLTEYKSTITSP